MFARTVGHAVVALGLLACVAAFAATPAPQTQARVVLPTNVTPEHYDIAIQPDAGKLSFRGHVDVRLKVEQPTDTIMLNAADLEFGKVSLSGQSASPRVELDAKEETAALRFPARIPAGVYTLSIDYTGKIFLQASGFFALDYAAGATQKRALFTQFENSDARRFVPSWDEPGRKATFTLTATVPANELAVSNMPISSSEDAGQGLKRVRFAESPKMSTYLLYFCVGDFERVHKQVGKTDVGVVVKRGDTAHAQYALDAASQLLPFYDDYFGTPYPLPKLDMIGGPGVSQFFGAMENWGAIFYFESDLLIDPRISTDDDRMKVFVVIAHEMAHQWFGDLVTMNWWDDLWLNEGFASWMENKATDHFHPEWKIWLQALSAEQGVMRSDASEGTHPIVLPIRDVFEASNAFDEITYKKGEAVIRMLEAYVGEQDFRTGVRNYMKKYAYANTVTDDLWHEIDAVTAKKITQVAHDFTLQAGVPLIGVDSGECANGQRTLSLTQDRFAIDDSGRAAQAWHVPVNIGRGKTEPLKSVIVSGSQPTKVTIDSCAPFVINSGQTAYFRVRYAQAPFAELSTAFAKLSPADQIGTLKNTAALAETGRTPYADFLELAGRLPLDADPVVWSALVEQVGTLDEFHNDLPTQRAFRAYESRLLGPKLAQLGWDAKAGESDNVKVLRSELLEVLGHAQDPSVVAEARKRFAQFLEQPQSISASVRSPMLHTIATNADAATWEKLRQLAQHAPTEIEKGQYVVLLGQAEDPKLAQRALDLALTEEEPPTLRPRLIHSVSNRYPEMAVQFTIAHWDKISPMLESTSRPQFVPRLASGSTQLKILEPLNAFAKAHMPPTTHRVLAKSVSSIRYNAQVVTRLAEVDKWIGQKAPGGRASAGAP